MGGYGRVEIEIKEEQQGFRKGRGTDGLFALRQLVEKELEVQSTMALGFVDLEKADDTVPRERDGDGNTEMDGSARRSQVGGRV